MGATSEDFIDMREKEHMINVTFRIKGKNENAIENYIHENTDVINYKKIKDHQELYEKDSQYRKLVKLNKQARVNKEDYEHRKS